MNDYREKIEWIQSRIAAACKKAGRNPDEVTLIAVSKYIGIEETRYLLQSGILDLGENRVQPAVAKISELSEIPARWHFIGSLQTNKVREAIPFFSMIHSLDRPSLAKELQRQAEKLERHIDCLVQVNVSGELTKSGLSAEEVRAFLDEIRSLDLVRVRGLMTMAPYTIDAEETRPVFHKLRTLRDSLRDSYTNLEHLSMGMSSDFEVAVEEGATMVRVGSILVKS